jgi:hypothetical protein
MTPSRSLSGDENGFKNISPGAFIAEDRWQCAGRAADKELPEGCFASL